MGAAERRFGTVVWFELILFKDILLFIFLTLPETTAAIFGFLFHFAHIFTIILGVGSLSYPGNATTVRPLIALSCLNVVLDFAAAVFHAMAARSLEGRAFVNQFVYIVYALLFVVVDFALIARVPPADTSVCEPPPGVLTDVAVVIGGGNKRPPRD